MPQLALELPQTYDNITRPISTEVVRDLIDRFQLPNDTSILYTGSGEVAAQRGSLLAQKQDLTAFPFTERVRIEVEENYMEQHVLTTAIKKDDNKIVFADHALGVYIKPIYTRTECSISFTYRATNKTKALRWRDGLRRKSSEGMQALLHEFLYHYTPPAVFIEILREIHKGREAIAGYNQTFEEWLIEKFTPRMGIVSTLDGDYGILSISEKQINVVGWFDFVDQPGNAEKNREGETWEVNFTYVFQYDKPTGMVIKYPVSVHNQLLNPKYLDTTKVYNPYEEGRRPSLSGHLNDQFSIAASNLEPGFVGIVIPPYDDWKPINNKYRTVPILTSIVELDLRDPSLIVNLQELGDNQLDPDIISFLLTEYPYITNHMTSAFHVTFYVGDLPLDPEKLTIDSDLNLRSTYELNPRLVYHFRFSITFELSLMTKRAKDALRNNPVVCKKVFKFLDGLHKPGLNNPDRAMASRMTDRAKRANGWYTKRPSRPGASLPDGDYAHIKPLPGNPYRFTKVGNQTRHLRRPTFLPPGQRGTGELCKELVIINDSFVTEASFNLAASLLIDEAKVSHLGSGMGLKSIMNSGIIAKRVG